VQKCFESHYSILDRCFLASGQLASKSLLFISRFSINDRRYRILELVPSFSDNPFHYSEFSLRTGKRILIFILVLFLSKPYVWKYVEISKCNCPCSNFKTSKCKVFYSSKIRFDSLRFNPCYFWSFFSKYQVWEINF